MALVKRDSAGTISEVVERNTGMTAEEFLRDPGKGHIDQLKEAADLIRSYIAAHEDPQITIVGDYDVDGDTATAILYWALRAMGVNAQTRIPKRFTEGYGMNKGIVSEMQGDDRLIITVDNGISAHEAIGHAKNRGYTVVVTDHHLPVKDKDGKLLLPPADIIVDPHVYPERSDFEDYCGAGLAYRLALELVPEVNLVQLLVLASIGTVADVMPLVGENRQIVIAGLKALNEGKNLPGMAALSAAMNLDGHANEGTYGFTIGPVMNAGGRLYDDGASRVVALLKAERGDPTIAETAAKLVRINDVRKQYVREGMAEAEKQLTEERPIVLYIKNIHEGVIGIIAGQLAEKYHCPAIVFTDVSEGGVLKGSGRSSEGIHLKDALDKIQEHLTGYGGHAGAAGLTILPEKLDTFRAAFKEACGPISVKTGPEEYDLPLTQDYAGLFEELQTYAPYGEGNPPIEFGAAFDLSQGTFQKMGDGSHFRVAFPGTEQTPGITIIGFGMTERYESLGQPEQIRCKGYLEGNWWKGNLYYNFRMTYFEPLEPSAAE